MKLRPFCTALMAVSTGLLAACDSGSTPYSSPAMTGFNLGNDSAWQDCENYGNIALFADTTDPNAVTHPGDEFSPTSTDGLELRANERGFTVGATNEVTQLCGIKVTVGKTRDTAEAIYLTSASGYGSYSLPAGDKKVLLVEVIAFRS